MVFKSADFLPESLQSAAVVEVVPQLASVDFETITFLFDSDNSERGACFFEDNDFRAAISFLASRRTLALTCPLLSKNYNSN